MEQDSWDDRAKLAARSSGPESGSRLPGDYRNGDLGFDLRHPETASPTFASSRAYLEVLRFASLRAQGEKGNPDCPLVVWQGAYRWLRFLIGEDSPRSFYLPHYRAEDRVFYQGRSNLRPKPREDWGLKLRVEGEWGPKELEWLKHPERLTIAELEVALALFQWDEEKPRLVCWARAGAYPHILWRVHAFLLRSYCFDLLEPLCEAMAEAGVDKAPFRAGEFWHWYPRVGGLAAVGLLGLISIDALRNAAYEAPVCVLLLTCVAGIWVLLGVLGVDVFKQNRGLMTDHDHAQPRCERAAAIAVFWGVFLVACYFALAKLAGAVRPDFSDLGSWLRSLLAGVAFGIGSALLGSLLQWFWEDRAMTEPI